MAAPNLSEIITTTMRGRDKMLADNFTHQTALMEKMRQRGKVKPIGGGSDMTHPIAYKETDTFKRYSGGEFLDIRESEVLTAATFSYKQAAISIVITGLEKLMNAGRAKMLDLMEERIQVAEDTMNQKLSGDLYSDGTADGGKQVNGLQAIISTSPATGTVGSINRANHSFWRNKYDATNPSKSNVEQLLRQMWLKLVRGREMPDLIVAGNTSYEHYWNSLTDRQRFTHTGKMAKAGWPSLGFLSAEVVLDGGIGGDAPENSFYFLNCKYLFWRPHSDRNMVHLEPRRPVNQDAEISLIGWCGNLTTNNLFMQGRVGSN